MLSRAKAVLKDSITPSGMGVIEIHGGKLTNGLVLATADAITTLAGAVDDFKKQYGVSKNKAVDYLLCDALGWPLRAAEAAESAGKSVFLKAKALAPEAKRLGGGGIESLLLAELLAQPWTAAAYAAAQTGDKQPRDALPPPSPVAAPALAALSWAPPLPAPPPPAPPPCPHCTAAAADELGNFLPSMFEVLFEVLKEKPVKRRRIADTSPRPPGMLQTRHRATRSTSCASASASAHWSSMPWLTLRAGRRIGSAPLTTTSPS